MHYFSNLFL